MHPYDFWYNHNPKVKDYLNNYYYDNLQYVQDKEVRKDCSYLFNEGNVMEKCLVLSLLSAIKLLSDNIGVKIQ